MRGAMDAAERAVQSRPGGYNAWRDYWNAKNADARRVHSEISQRGFILAEPGVPEFHYVDGKLVKVEN